jgi:hypothetical protein
MGLVGWRLRIRIGRAFIFRCFRRERVPVEMVVVEEVKVKGVMVG